MTTSYVAALPDVWPQFHFRITNGAGGPAISFFICDHNFIYTHIIITEKSEKVKFLLQAAFYHCAKRLQHIRAQSSYTIRVVLPSHQREISVFCGAVVKCGSRRRNH